MTCVGAVVGVATGAVVGLPTVGELVDNGIEARGSGTGAGAGAGLARTGAEVGLRVGLLPRVLLETGIIVGDPPPPPPPPPLLTVKWLDVGCRVG